MANGKDLERLVFEIQNITQAETGIKPAKSIVSGLFRKRGNRLFIPTEDIPQWLKDSMVGGSRAKDN